MCANPCFNIALNNSYSIIHMSASCTLLSKRWINCIFSRSWHSVGWIYWSCLSHWPHWRVSDVRVWIEPGHCCEWCLVWNFALASEEMRSATLLAEINLSSFYSDPMVGRLWMIMPRSKTFLSNSVMLFTWWGWECELLGISAKVFMYFVRSWS